MKNVREKERVREEKEEREIERDDFMNFPKKIETFEKYYTNKEERDIEWERTREREWDDFINKNEVILKSGIFQGIVQ